LENDFKQYIFNLRYILVLQIKMLRYKLLLAISTVHSLQV